MSLMEPLRGVHATEGSGLCLALVLLSGLTLACAALACGGRPAGPPADLILVNGSVLTLDDGHPEAQAVAVRQGRIQAVGTRSAIESLAGPGTRVVDLGGGLAVPGLIDAHGHVRSLGEQMDSLQLQDADSIDEVVRRVRLRAADLADGEWVTGGGWNNTRWPGARLPDHRPLDEAAPGHPVWLSRVDGHAGWANRAAMKLAGITRATPDPPGGRIEHDASGEPTGVLIDNATDLIDRVRPAPGRERIKHWIRTALDRCAEVGLTEVHDAGVDEEEAAAYREMADAGQLPVRVYLMWSGMSLGKAGLERRLREPPLVDYRDRLTLRAVKLMIDGAMGSRGAVFHEDYADDPGNRGLFVIQPETIEEDAALALRHGYQVCTHAIGDRGISLVLDAYEKILAGREAAPGSGEREATPGAAGDPRLRIEHLQCVAAHDIPRLRALGVIASMQPSHATSDMGWADDRVGRERGRGLYAWRWVLDGGVMIAAGSDFPVDPEMPLVGLHSAVTRQDLKDRPAGGWHPEQSMTLMEALRAYTQGAAYAAFEEDRKGRIAPGFWADLTVFRQDPRALAVDRIDDAGIAYTIVGGTVVHEASREPAGG